VVGHHIVQLPGDAAALVGHGPLGQRPLVRLGGQRPALQRPRGRAPGVHRTPHEEGHQRHQEVVAHHETAAQRRAGRHAVDHHVEGEHGQPQRQQGEHRRSWPESGGGGVRQDEEGGHLGQRRPLGQHRRDEAGYGQPHREPGRHPAQRHRHGAGDADQHSRKP
jgi:hypothetical protein